MKWIEHGLVALAIGIPLMAGLILMVTASRVTRLRLRSSSLVVDSLAVPAPVRLTLDQPRAMLERLGFRYRYSTSQEQSVDTGDDQPVFSDVYQHELGLAMAGVTPSVAPELGEPCSVLWFTLLQDGSVRATVNCNLHNHLLLPTGWDYQDPYLPDMSQAWQRHRDRLGAGDAIVTDAAENLRVNKVATDTLMTDGERQGLLVRRADHWQVRWTAAIPFAWRLLLGTRKAAVARARAGKMQPLPGEPVPASAIEADIDAFNRQLAVQRSLGGSRQKKIKVFLVTAVLFLAVGSLWISWTLLPSLLVVIALHEGGHYLAMKLSGYRHLSVYFVPGLGGLATGEKASAGPWEKLFVYLAGPIPGICLAGAGLIAQYAGVFQPAPWLREFLVLCFVVNYLNLLPITPLDGGRVVETFLFARWPVARFLFALLGVAAFLAFGFGYDDKVMLVIAILVGLSLPHQYRVMRVDRAIERNGPDILDESGAVERVFTALQLPKFARWPFSKRAAAATALLPELQGRRAGVPEAAGGLTIYLACLAVPLVVMALIAQGTVAEPGKAAADDVEPTAARPRTQAPMPDWYAQAAQVQSLPQEQRLAVLLGAADRADEEKDIGKREGFLRQAWELAQQRPAHDHDRALTMFALAQDEEQGDLRRKWYRQILTGLAGMRDKPSLLLLADASERLSWDVESGERVALQRQALAHRQQALESGDYALVAARRSLAQALDNEGAHDEAEALLRQNVESISVAAPTDRTRDALSLRTRRTGLQVELAWFLGAHGKPKEANDVLQAASAGVPRKITVSWVHPNRRLREASLWATLQRHDVEAVKAAWQRYEDSMRVGSRAFLASYQLDRLVVAGAIADEAMKKEALDGIAQAFSDGKLKKYRADLCAGRESSQYWRERQWEGRVQAATIAGLCARS